MKKFLSLIAILSLVFSPVTPAFAATQTWDGLGGNNNWANGTNWVSGTAPVANDSLVFAGTTRLTTNNNTTANRVYAGITFDGLAGAFTLSGNAIKLGGDVVNNASNLETINLNITLTGNRSFNASSGDLAVSGVISETGSSRDLTKSGANILTLSSANTYTGLTTVSAGTLAYGASDIIATGDVTVNGATAILDLGANHTDTVGTVTVTGGGSITGTGTSALTSTGTFEMKNGTVSAILDGAAALNKTTTNTVTLSGPNTYTGQTKISNGTLSVSSLNSVGVGAVATSSLGAPTSIPNGTITLGNGANTGTLLYTGVASETTDRVIDLAGTTGGGTIDQSGGGLLKFTSDFTATGAGSKTLTLQGSTAGTGEISGAIVDNGGGNTTAVTKSGTGTWTLSGINTYTGITTVSGGTLIAANTSALGEVSSGASLKLNTGTTLDLATDTSIGAYNTTLGSGATVTIQSDLATAGTGITHTLGTLTTAGGNTLDIQAGVNVAGGSPVIAFGVTTLGGAGSSTITFNPTTADVTLTDVTGAAGAVNTKTLALGGTSTGNQITGIIGDGGAGGDVKITKSNTGTWTLSGVNTYSGNTTISAGTLRLGADDVISDGVGKGNVSVTGTLDLNGFSDTINGLSGAGTVDNVAGGGASTLTAGNNDVTSTFSGAIQNASGVVALTKIGTGTLTLSGANTYSGVTTINGGTLKINAANNLGDASATNTISIGGGTLESGNGTYALGATRAITMTGAATIQVLAGGVLTVDGTVNNGGNLLTVTGAGDTTISGVISNTGGLTKSLAGTLILSGANTYTGQTIIHNGILSAASLNSVAGGSASSSLGAPVSVANGTINLGNFANTGTLLYTGVASETTDRVIDLAGTTGGGTIDQSGTGLLEFTSDFTATGAGSKTLTLQGSTAGTGEISGAIVDNGGGNTTSVTKAGTGTWTLSGANTYTGLTDVQAGTLAYGANNVIAAAANVSVSGGILDISTFNDTVNGVQLTNGSITGTTGILTSVTDFDVQNGTASAILDGAVGLTKTTGGTVTLSGANTYTGITALNAGQLNINNASAIGTGAFTIAGGTIDNTSGGAITLANNNLQNWNGDFTFTGTNDLNLGTGAVTLGANRIVTVNGGNLTVGGAIGNGGGFLTLDKNGAGTLTLNGVNTYAGLTTVNAGTLAFGSNTTLGGGLTMTPAGGGTLDLQTYTSTVAGAFSLTTATETLTTTISGATIGNLTAGSVGSIANGTVNLIVTGTPTIGTYNVVTDTAGGGAVNADSLALTKTGGARFNVALVPGATQNDLQISVTRGAVTFESLGGGGNVAAVGATLDQIADGNPTGDMATVISILDAGTNAADQNAMSTMTPDVSSGTAEGSRALTGQGFTMISNRLGGARSGFVGSGVSAGEMLDGVGVWMQGLGSHIKQDARQGIEGFKANLFGTMVGVDKVLDNHWRAGLAGGYGWAGVKSKTPGSPSDNINSFQGTLYGSYDSLDLNKARQGGKKSYEAVRNQLENSWYVDGMFSFTQDDYDSRREIWLGNTQRVAKADHYGQQYSTNFEAGYKFVFEKTKNLEVTPFMSLGYNYLYMNKYKEDGANALNLTVNGEGFHQLEQGLGTKLAYPIATKKVGTFIPSVKGAWLYDYIGDRFETTASFSGGGPSFNTQGAKPAKNGMLFGAELAFLNKGNMTVTGNWDIELKNQYMSNTYYGTVRYDF